MKEREEKKEGHRVACVPFPEKFASEKSAY